MDNKALEKSGLVVWLTGLSGAGKTTLAFLLKDKLEATGTKAIVLDGDQLRSGINKDLGFSNEGRLENIRRAAEIAKIISANNIVAICSFITPMQQQRSLAREIIGSSYFEAFIECPIEICEGRDVKGLYKKARHNEIKDFTGVQAGFDMPLHPDVVVHTSLESPMGSLEKLYAAVSIFVRLQ